MAAPPFASYNGDMSKRELTLRTAASIAEIGQTAWDACAGNGGDKAGLEFNPSLSYAFLSALEQCGAVSPETGWAPRHLALEADGEVLAVAPAYLKSHSQGEYVFDHGWADAFERAGGRYYPKLQIAVPFTPVPGRRILIAQKADDQTLCQATANGIMALAERYGLSSAHLTFLSEAEWNVLGKAGFLLRQDQQFHWQNRPYPTFDDFLAALSSRKRKAIKRERREALAAGITVEHLTGSAITEAHWDAFFAFYLDTGGRKWGRPYLNRHFFSLIGQSLADHILLIMAKRDGRYIAGALNLIGSHALYGRNWGSIEHHPFLHFEICYYQAIDFAIAHRLARVEAGAQGEHKLARGYLPSPTYSAHFIRNPGFRQAVAAYLERERHAVGEMIETLSALGPFRRGEAELDM